MTVTIKASVLQMSTMDKNIVCLELYGERPPSAAEQFETFMSLLLENVSNLEFYPLAHSL